LDVLHILTYASVEQISLEEACHQLENVPCPNTVRSQLNESMLKEIETVEDNINEALVSQWPKRMTKKAHKVAIFQDRHLFIEPKIPTVNHFQIP